MREMCYELRPTPLDIYNTSRLRSPTSLSTRGTSFHLSSALWFSAYVPEVPAPFNTYEKAAGKRTAETLRLVKTQFHSQREGQLTWAVLEYLPRLILDLLNIDRP